MALTDPTLPQEAPLDLPREALRARLVARGAFLLSAIDTHRNELQQPAAATGNTFIAGQEGAAADADDERDVALWQRLQHEFDEVEQALRRLDTPGYGRCESCQARIDLGRLDAQPEARRCLHCQTQIESQMGRGARASAWGA